LPLTPELLGAAVFVCIMTDHDETDWDSIATHATSILDSRNATRHVEHDREKIVLL